MERWKILPSQWDYELDDEDKAQLMGYVGTQADMAAWENYIDEKKQIADRARQTAEAEMRKVNK